MALEAHDSVLEVMNHVDVEAGELITSLARERIAAQLASSVNLSQRATQVCALQIAAATFAATLASTTHGRAALWAVAVATMLFIVGALLALRSAFSERASSPGLSPSFFRASLGQAPLTFHGALAWTATTLDAAITRNTEGERRRAVNLNRSLVAASAGAVVLGIVTVGRAIAG